MINAVIYARYSSHNQRDVSVDQQIAECTKYAEQFGMRIIGQYVDRSKTGKEAEKRLEFQRMIKDSAKGHFQAVIMYTLDRFARNRYDSAMYKSRLKKNGVRIYYAEQHIPDGPEGIILESVLEGFAEYYSENLSRNIRRGMNYNAMNGLTNGGTLPLGYRSGSDKRYEIDPAGASAVQMIFSMYADGHSAQDIIYSLNSAGYRTAKGNVFSRGSLDVILRNKKYIGIYQSKDIVVPGAIPRIISDELFERVQQKLSIVSKSRAHYKGDVDYLLSGKVFCGHCGSPMLGESGTSRNGRTYNYYKCSCRKSSRSCSKKSERKDWLEDVVTRETARRVLQPAVIEQIADRAVEILNRENSDTSLLESLKSAQRENDRAIQNIMNAMMQGIITPSTKETLLGLEAEKAHISEQIETAQVKKPTLTKEHIIFWLESFIDGDVESDEYRRRIIDSLLSRVFVYDDDGGTGKRLVFTFNLSRNNTATVNCSDIAGCAPPNRPSRWRWSVVLFIECGAQIVKSEQNSSL